MKWTIKYFILTILLQMIYCPSEISGQSADHRNMLVYWYNRERLKHFVIPGLKMGESNVASIRNRLDYNGIPNGNLDFGQNGVYFGYYLGTLATEYRILMNGNHYQAAHETEREVVYALHQYIAFMDSSEHWWGQEYQDSYNGFFTRQCIPKDFLNINSFEYGYSESQPGFPTISHKDILNYDINSSAIFNEQTREFPGLPGGHPFTVSGEHESTIDGLDLSGLGGMSEDELIGVIMGLALIHACMDDATMIVPGICKNCDETAKDIALKMLDFIKGPNFEWEIDDPTGSLVDLCGDYAYGYAMVGEYFGENKEHYFINYVAMEASKEWWWWISETSFGQLYNDIMAETLAAIGNSWPYNRLAAKLDEYCIQAFYLYLAKICHPNEVDLEEADIGIFSEQLNSPPVEGPFNYGDNSEGNGVRDRNGWATTYKWRNTCSDQENGILAFLGNFNGCDYMLAYNFQKLVHNMDPYTYFPRDVIVTKSIRPVICSECDNKVFGSNVEPKSLHAFDSILSAAKILNNVRYSITKSYHYEALEQPYYPNFYIGEVQYIAGKKIVLKPSYGHNGSTGFLVERGARFSAKIDDQHMFSDKFITENTYIDDDNGIRNIILEDFQCFSPQLIKELQDSLILVDNSMNDHDSNVKTDLLKLFPNPNDGRFSIFVGNSTRRSYHVFIFNVSMNLIYSRYIQQESQINVDISDEPVGVYFLCIECESGKQYFKIIKK